MIVDILYNIMMNAKWEVFFKEKILKIFNECHTVIDIGGGLRIDKTKNNRFDSKRAWILPLLDKTVYKTLDPVSDYNPDIIGDIHNLPFENDSVESIICLAVLEHVKNPFKAVSEMFRVLKPGGYCFAYLPFLYNYHPMKGYYDDYFRFTEDGIKELFKDFYDIQIINVRGRFETLALSSPVGPLRPALCACAKFVDRIFGTENTKQTAGFFVFGIA
ncbi:MAG: methyltransferase domain-containing protein [Patescibacteria group bacterium]|nr:methyltransferase domain-containing protein [Patescibacteria group bacterium]